MSAKNPLKHLVIILLFSLQGCGSVSVLKISKQDANLLESLTQNVTTSKPEELSLYLSDEVRAELDLLIKPEWHDSKKLKELRHHFFSQEGLNLTYDGIATKTAAETYATARGNCLAMSNLFVAAARHVGLDSKFRTVSVKPTWDRFGATMIRYEHIVAVGKLRDGTEYVVDFLPEFALYGRVGRIVSDEVALTYYYNNLGAESVVNGDNESAVEDILKAIKLRPKFSDAWNNLGAAYRRMNQPKLAELSYLQALRIDGDNYSALSNLSQFYVTQGRQEEAEQFVTKVNRYYQRNPYFHFYIAQLHFLAEEYEQALDSLVSAIRLKRTDADFYDALAETLAMLGDMDGKLFAEKSAQDLRERASTPRATSYVIRPFITNSRLN